MVRNGCAEDVMLPHKPDLDSERIRIQELGGLVVFVDTWRVNGILSVTRAIGDPDHKPYVIAAPSQSKFEIDTSLDFLVLGCDGLFDQLTSQDIASHVFEFLCKNETRDVQEVIHDVSLYLSQMAIREGSSDNITSIVLFFKPFEQLVSTGLPVEPVDDEMVVLATASKQQQHTEMINNMVEAMTASSPSPTPPPPTSATLPTNGGHFPYTDFSELPIGSNFKLRDMEEAAGSFDHDHLHNNDQNLVSMVETSSPMLVDEGEATGWSHFTESPSAQSSEQQPDTTTPFYDDDDHPHQEEVSQSKKAEVLSSSNNGKKFLTFGDSFYIWLIYITSVTSLALLYGSVAVVFGK